MASKVRRLRLTVAMAMAMVMVGTSTASLASRYSLLASEEAERGAERRRQEAGSQIQQGFARLADLFEPVVPASCSWKFEHQDTRYMSLSSTRKALRETRNRSIREMLSAGIGGNGVDSLFGMNDAA
eukprot:749497-Hanusia_phi.AAC.6